MEGRTALVPIAVKLRHKEVSSLAREEPVITSIPMTKAATEGTCPWISHVGGGRRQGSGTFAHDTERATVRRGNPEDPHGEELERTLLPGTVSTHGGGPCGDGGYVYGTSCLTSSVCSSCCCGNELHGVSSTTPCLGCALWLLLSASGCLCYQVWNW